MLERPADHWLMTSKGIRRKIIGVDTMRATVQGDTMDITLRRTLKDGTETSPRAMGGKRQAPLPQRPDLKRIRLGNPIMLFPRVK